MKKICVFCSSSSSVSPIFQSEIKKFGELLAINGFELVYGGASGGLMGDIANACIYSGGRVHGIIPKQFASASEKPHSNLTSVQIVEDFFERKKLMLEQSDCFLAFPGGIGTLDEVVEMLCYKQVGIHTKPIVFINSLSFWDGLIDFLVELKERGMVSQDLNRLYKKVDTIEEAIEYLVSQRIGK